MFVAGNVLLEDPREIVSQLRTDPKWVTAPVEERCADTSQQSRLRLIDEFFM